MLRRREQNSRAQVFVEYATIISIVVIVLISMNAMIKRGLQGMIKSVADQIGDQANAEQTVGNFEKGYLESQYSSVRSASNKTTTEVVGNIEYGYESVVRMATNSVTNVGFTKE